MNKRLIIRDTILTILILVGAYLLIENAFDGGVQLAQEKIETMRDSTQ